MTHLQTIVNTKIFVEIRLIFSVGATWWHSILLFNDILTLQLLNSNTLQIFNAAFYPTPNIQIGPNYQGGAPAHFHAATYPTLNIQSGPNNQAEAPSNKHTDKPSTQLSFLVKFTPDQAETYFTRAKNMGLASACGHQLTQEIVQDVNSHIANGKKRNAQRFLRGNTTFASHGAGPCPSLPANQTCAILSAISANIYMYWHMCTILSNVDNIVIKLYKLLPNIVHNTEQYYEQ